MHQSLRGEVEMPLLLGGPWERTRGVQEPEVVSAADQEMRLLGSASCHDVPASRAGLWEAWPVQTHTGHMPWW